MKRQNPIQLFFKDRYKFDWRNPIIVDLPKEVNKTKLAEAEMQSILGNAPAPTVIKLCSRLNKLNVFNEAQNLQSDENENLDVNFKSND